MITQKSCYRCGTELPGNARYCLQCGAHLSRERLPGKGWLVVLAGGAFVAVLSTQITEGVQRWQGRTKPTVSYSPELHGGGKSQPKPQAERQGVHQESADPDLELLRKNAAEHPQDLEMQKMYGLALVERVRGGVSGNTQGGERDLLLEAIDVLSQVVQGKPNDKEVLIALGDLTFDEQVFPKAEEYYKKALNEDPSNFIVQAKYGSVLAFMNRYEEAERVLLQVVEKDPTMFQALAYLSITYAQSGNLEKAKAYGIRASENAPSNEAKERMTGFLASLDQKKNQSPLDTFFELVKKNPVAGPKFISGRQEGARVFLSFRGFPMSAMPPFAKEKFFTSLKSALNVPGVNELVFEDADTHSIMETVSVTK